VLLSYALLSVLARLKVHRLVVVALVAVGLAIGAGALLTGYAGKNVLHRQETLTDRQHTEEHGLKGKERNVLQLGRDITGAPLGAGLGTGGSAGGFGGKQKVIIEGAGTSREGDLNLLVVETGVLGMGLWVVLVINVIWLAVRRLRLIADPELRSYLTAIFAAFIALTLAGFSGPSLAGTSGAFLWFAPGVAALWLAGPGFALARRRRAR
jgi:O-antigen ligase